MGRGDRLAVEIRTETYEKNGALYWNSNDTPIMLECFAEAGITPPANQAAEYDRHTTAFLAEYRKAQANLQPSAEEMFEMRAAFGPDAEVVNVITGRKIRTGR